MTKRKLSREWAGKRMLLLTLLDGCMVSVVCNDLAHRTLLLARARAVARKGNPNTERFCLGCKALRPLSDFYPSRTNDKCISCIGRCPSRQKGHGSHALTA